MGIGAGFAMGLVKGFTQNMLVEQQKRISDREKVNALEQAVFQKTIGPADERSKAGINAAKEMIKNAKSQMDERGGIDLFGTASGELDLDMASIQNTLDDVAEGAFHFGSGTTKIPVMMDRPNKIGTGDAFALFSEFEGILQNETYRQNLQNDPDAWNQMNGMINSSRQALMFANRTATRAAGEAYQALNWDDKSFSWIKDFNTLRPDGSDKIETNAMAASKVLSTDGQELNPAWVVVNEDGVEHWGNFTFSNDGNIAANQKMAMANMGKYFGAPSSQDVYPLYRRNVAIPGVDDQTLITFFSDSIALGTPGSGAHITNVENLNPNSDTSFLYRLTPEEYVNLSKKLDRGNSTGTFKNVVAALYPYMLPSAQTRLTPQEDGIFKNVKEKQTRESFARQMYYGSDVYDTKSFDDLRTEYETNKQVVEDTNLLVELVRDQNQIQAYQGIKQAFIRTPINFAKALISDFGDENSVIKAVGIDTSNITVREDGYKPSDPNEKFITQDFLRKQDAILQEAAQRDRDDPRSDGITYAEIATLKIGLAFRMARAADPSGRLSNQDVQQQLDRLGNDFDSPEQVAAKIALIQREFQRRVDKLEILTTYASGQGRLTPEGAAVIEAAIAADHIIRASGKGMSSAQTPVEDQFSDYEQSSLFTTEDGTPVFMAFSSDPSSAASRKFEDTGKTMYFMKITGEDGSETYQALPADAVLTRAQAQPQTVDAAPPVDVSVRNQQLQEFEAGVDKQGLSQGQQQRVDELRGGLQSGDRTPGQIKPRPDNQSADTTKEVPPPAGALDPMTHSVQSGNAEDGARIIDEDTGIVVPGTWIIKNGMWVPKGGVAPTQPVM